MRNKGLNFIKGITICALGLSLVAPQVKAGTISIDLDANQKKACSPQLGNTTGKYCVGEQVLIKSKFGVETYLYSGKTSDHCGTIETHWVLSPGERKSKVVSVSKNKATLARVTLYSNYKSNQQAGCIAYGTLYNF